MQTFNIRARNDTRRSRNYLIASYYQGRVLLRFYEISAFEREYNGPLVFSYSFNASSSRQSRLQEDKLYCF